MKRLVGLVAGIGLLFVLPLTAGAASSPFDSANATGARTAGPFAPRMVSFDAQNGPTGVTGYAVSKSPTASLNFSGHVTCLLVDGNRAAVGAVIDHAKVAAEVGETWIFAVEDNGNPASGTPDQLSAYFIDPLLDPTDCSFGTNAYATFAPIVKGNLNVYDAP